MRAPKTTVLGALMVNDGIQKESFSLPRRRPGGRRRGFGCDALAAVNSGRACRAGAAVVPDDQIASAPFLKSGGVFLDECRHGTASQMLTKVDVRARVAVPQVAASMRTNENVWTGEMATNGDNQRRQGGTA